MGSCMPTSLASTCRCLRNQARTCPSLHCATLHPLAFGRICYDMPKARPKDRITYTHTHGLGFISSLLQYCIVLVPKIVVVHHLSCMASNGLPSRDSTVAAMCRGVSPASSIWSCGAPWSMYLSGKNMDLSCKLPTQEHKHTCMVSINNIIPFQLKMMTTLFVRTWMML